MTADESLRETQLRVQKETGFDPTRPSLASDEPRVSYWHCERYESREQRDVVAAVLAEVARQDAGEMLDGDACSPLEGEIANAAYAIREAMRLSTEGA